MKSSELLRLAKNIIKNVNDWCTEDYRKRDNRLYTGHESYCAVGALGEAAKSAGITSFLVEIESTTEPVALGARTALTESAIEILGKQPDRHVAVIEVNDKLDHEKVMEMYDIAIAKLESAGQ